MVISDMSKHNVHHLQEITIVQFLNFKLTDEGTKGKQCEIVRDTSRPEIVRSIRISIKQGKNHFSRNVENSDVCKIVKHWIFQTYACQVDHH